MLFVLYKLKAQLYLSICHLLQIFIRLNASEPSRDKHGFKSNVCSTTDCKTGLWWTFEWLEGGVQHSWIQMSWGFISWEWGSWKKWDKLEKKRGINSEVCQMHKHSSQVALLKSLVYPKALWQDQRFFCDCSTWTHLNNGDHSWRVTREQ